MIKVTAGQSIYEVEEGTTLEQLAKQLQKKEEPVILLAYMDGKLTELFTEIKKDCHVRFVTLKEQAGYMAYKRTATFIFLKACEDLLGKGESTKIAIDYSIGNSIFCDFSSMERVVDDKFVHSIQKRMEQLYESDLPITKRSLDTDQASRYFDSVGFKGKRELFKFRRESKTNIYSMDGYDNYFYGYMAPSTGYIPTFLVSAYQHGVVLQIPKRKQTEEIVPFTPQPKLFHVMQRSREWTKTMGVDTVGALNDEITYGNINHLILLQEGLQEKLLADISDEIVSKNKRIILIAGPSSSGKTTFSHRLSIQLEIAGLTPHPVSMDDYFLDRELSPRDENGNYNFETIASLDVDLLTKHINQLLNGEEVDVPSYNFVTGKREYHGHKLKIGQKDVLVMEGIHGLNGTLTNEIPEDAKYRIYVSALNQINLDEHNRIPSSDGRLLRRIVRDAMTRGNDARETISRWDSVRKGEEDNIFPYQEEADVMFNSAQVYEIAVLKQYAEPLLFAVPKDCPEYQEAKRLLKFLEYFLNIPSEAIPKTSLLREFIGGSCFDV
ncbi:nucleoside kinase [Anaerostipes amylophilus]|uniref:nucleoside kinase n=1 Tax=Anaerostipes amylophilus TaxID=2981779 RepID=UPI0006C5466D|nr:nucleoside kinase [Anaerostipes amylophilus]MCU6782079.1 nucleoside kinase [Anaerostipes amylophilus]CUO41827.1 Uridine kinase [Anaerostipes hadrus]